MFLNVLNIFHVTCTFTSSDKKLLIFCFITSKLIVARHRKNTESPHFKQWLQELSHCLALEKLTYIVKGKPEKFFKVWNPFIGFLKEADPNLFSV